MQQLEEHTHFADNGSLIFANFVEFDSLYGHRRDPLGYAKALEWFDNGIASVVKNLLEDDLLIITADMEMIQLGLARIIQENKSQYFCTAKLI